MLTPVNPVNLVIEDDLSESVLRKLLETTGAFTIGVCHGKKGISYIKQKIKGFNNAAKGCPFIVLVDLDKEKCPPSLIKKWFSFSRHSKLIFRVAVREIEAWILADKKNISNYLGVRPEIIPSDVENIDNPKEFVVEAARKSKKREIRNDLVPADGSTAKTGKNYNGCLISFVHNYWNISEATNRSTSLKRALDAIRSFKL